MSGDALTDIDLTALLDVPPRARRAGHRVPGPRPDPVEFGGHRRLDDEGRVERFLEKPTWGQVFTDTVNTGIYVMEPDVLDVVGTERRPSRLVGRRASPICCARGAPVFGYVAEGYWEDVGTLESYLRVQADVLDRRVTVDIDGFEVAPGVWIAEGAEVDPGVIVEPRSTSAPYAKVEAGADLGAHTVLGTNVVVRSGARHRPHGAARQRVRGPGGPSCAAASSAAQPT